MHIVITNDDGIHAPGIRALAKAAKQLGRVTVIAPDSNRSANGHHKTLGQPLRLDAAVFPEADAAWVCDGTPADCACFAGLGFLDEPVDLLLSGVNPTPNLGWDISYSGTVMAAMEASLWKLPAAAFSIDCARRSPDTIDFSAINEILPRVVRMMMEHPLPSHTILNVNYPALPWEEIRGFKTTVCGGRIYHDYLVRSKDPFGRSFYWFGGDPPESTREEGSDGKALADGFVSVTPVHVDLTARSLADEMKNWTWE